MRAFALLCLIALSIPALIASAASDPSLECPETQLYCILEHPFGEGMSLTLVSPTLRVRLLTKGATLSAVQLRTPRAAWVDVALGFDTPEEFDADDAYMGRVVGRYAGRIARGEVTLDDVLYKLPQNNGDNTLHGGPDGFSFRQWNHTLLYAPDSIGVRLEMVSPHLDQGFPGALRVAATYTLPKRAGALLRWNLRAALTADSPVNTTTVNLCNHVYWNLNGVPRGASRAGRVAAPVTNHHMLLRSSHFLKTDAALLPWGEVTPVNGTAHDFRRMRPLKEGIDATAAEGRDPAGYDDPLSLDDWDTTLHEAAVLMSPETNITLRIETTSPAVVMYTANHLPEKVTGEAGSRFQRHGGIALETQYFPNSPHVPVFPSTELKKGNTYDETTVCRFSVE